MYLKIVYDFNAIAGIVLESNNGFFPCWPSTSAFLYFISFG